MAQESSSDSVARSLVFASSSPTHTEWLDRLKRRVAQYATELEWWDDSSVPQDAYSKNEIEAHIHRATVAVVLLSPDYLASTSKQPELELLDTETKSRDLRLLPVVVEPCGWERVEVLRRFQVWSGGRPLAELSRDALDRELKEIAHAILKYASSSAPWSPWSTDVLSRFSF